jgi:hypothetical protein
MISNAIALTGLVPAIANYALLPLQFLERLTDRLRLTV